MTTTRACYSLNAINAALDILDRIGEPHITRRSQYNDKCIQINDLLLFCREQINEFVFYGIEPDDMNERAMFPSIYKLSDLNATLSKVYNGIKYELSDIYRMVQSGEVDHV